eukprot:11662991-Alexandrium_andersonii.AAC.1
MVPEPAAAGHRPVHGVFAQAPLAQNRGRQDRSRFAILDDQDSHRHVAVILREETITRCDIWCRV